jgi:hypothetical protein
MHLQYCSYCGNVVVSISLNPLCLIRTAWKKIKLLFRPTKISRIKARLQGKTIAFFPRTYSHNVEYTLIQDDDKIRLESYQFNYFPERAVQVKEFDSLSAILAWIDNPKTHVGYDISYEAADWVRANQTEV